ncbi:MAG: Calx-beta domain-containing protein [Geitlerinemataceae cyanobacterium]
MSFLRKFSDLFTNERPATVRDTSEAKGFHRTMPLEAILTPSPVLPVDGGDDASDFDGGDDADLVVEDVSEESEGAADAGSGEEASSGGAEPEAVDSEGEELGEPLGFVDDEPEEESEAEPATDDATSEVIVEDEEPLSSQEEVAEEEDSAEDTETENATDSDAAEENDNALAEDANAFEEDVESESDEETTADSDAEQQDSATEAIDEESPQTSSETEDGEPADETTDAEVDETEAVSEDEADDVDPSDEATGEDTAEEASAEGGDLVSEEGSDVSEAADDETSDEQTDEELEEVIEDLIESDAFVFDLSAIDGGVFTVGDSGEVGVDFLYDGGSYKGQLAIFSLDGLDGEEFESFDAFVAETVDRASSNSDRGHLVINDKTEGAKFSSAENSDDYRGVKLFAMKAGDTFAVMLVPDSTLDKAADGTSTSTKVRPLFSLSSANPDDELHFAQIADVTGDGSTFVLEDKSTEAGTDRDYNDIIFRVTGATGEAIELDEVLGETLGDRVRNLLENTPTDVEPGDSTPGEVEPTEPTPVDGAPADGEPGDETPADPKNSTPEGGEPGEPTPVDGTPADSTPTDAEPGDSEPIGGTPVEPEPGDETPAEPEDSTPGGGESSEPTPVDGTPVDAEPGDNTPEEGEADPAIAASAPVSLTPDFEFLDNPIELEGGGWFFGGKSPDSIDFQATYSNLSAADTTNTDQLWEGGELGLALDGEGVKVGVWDGGKIRGSHQELSGRVSYGEDVQSSALYSSHATHVAGTIIGTGVDGEARGMASAAKVISYDYNGDITNEIEAEAQAGLTLANHSHGQVSGWIVSNFDKVQNWSIDIRNKLDLGDFYVWYGDRATSSDASQMFGSYSSRARDLDRVLHENPELLSIWAAGNDRDDEFNAMRYKPTGSWSSQVLDGQTSYLTYLSQPIDSVEWHGAGWYYLSATGAATYAPTKDGGVDGYGTLSNGGQTAKNTLVVGAIEDITKDPFDASDVQTTTFSGWGSTDDGRLGIDLVANGHSVYSSDSGSDTNYSYKSGTSMAAPNATGTAALLTQHYRDTYGGANPLSATLKAIMLHTAKDAGEIGPDYVYGWGVLDGAAAAQYITQAKEEEVARTIEAAHDGTEQSYQVTSDGSQPLKATIVWTDPAATREDQWTDSSAKKLVNDLDVWIIDPNGDVHRPWTLDPNNPDAAAKRDNRNELDNVEQVLIDNPVAGTYTVYVGNTGALQDDLQNFSLLLGGLGEDDRTSTIMVTTLDGEAAETEAWETADPATFVISRSGGDNSQAEQVYYTVSGTAKNGEDYALLSGIATIPAGQTSTPVTINPLNDTQYEALENVVFRVQERDSYQLGSTVQGIATIADNDEKPVLTSTITVEVDDDIATEAAEGETKDPAAFIIRRSGGDNSQPETVRYTINLKDKDGNVYRTQTGVATISAGYSGLRLRYTPADDSTYDGTETIEFVVTSDPSYKLGGTVSGTATLLDNELPPKSTLNVTVKDGAAAETAWYESPDPAVFEITRSDGDNSKAETVYYAVSGTASNGDDYAYLSGTLVIPAGEASATVSIQPQNDSVYEGAESVTFSISSDSSYELGSTTSGTATILDNDIRATSTITVEVDDDIATETAEGETTDPAAFIIRRNGGDNSQPETVRYTINLKDRDGNVYRTQTGVATISAGYSGLRLRYTPADDSTYDGTETIEFVVTSDPSYKLGGTISGTATLLDNELPPKSTLNVTVKDGTAAETAWYESPDPATFEITRSGGDNSKAETVYYTVGGTAANGEDYAYLSGVVTIPAGATSTTASIAPQDDSVYEGVESVTFKVSSDSSYELGSTASGTATIVDNDEKPVSTIVVEVEDGEAAETVAGEEANTAKFIIRRSGGDNSQSEDVFYNIDLKDKDGNVYRSRTGVVTIPAGYTSAWLTYTPADDSTYDGTESIEFSVTSDPSYKLGGVVAGTAALLDNELPPKSTLNVMVKDGAASETAWYESPDPAEFEISRSGGDNSKAETVYYTVSGTASNGADYVYLSGAVTIPAGEVSTKVSIQPQDDSVYEGAESVNFSISSDPSYELGSSVRGTATIADNDEEPVSTITVEVDDDTATETAEGEPTDPAAFIIRRNGGDNSQPETVRYTINLKDKDGNIYRTQTGVTTISAGFSGVRLRYTPFDDSTYDGTESIEFSVTSDPNYKLGGTTSGTATLLDNEIPKSVIGVSIADSWSSENNDSAQFRISRSGGDNSKAEAVYYTLKGVAENGVDYHYLSGIATIPAGASNILVTVNPIDDSIYEGAESIVFEVSSHSSYTLSDSTQSAAIIHDNDHPKSVAFGISWEGELSQIDLESGEVRSLGSTGFTNLNSLTTSSQSKLLTAANLDSPRGEIIEIDPTTGNSSVLYDFDNDFGGVKASIRGMAYAPDGSLYVIHNASGNGTIGADELYRVSPTTGTTQRLFALGAEDLQSLAISPDSGLLYSFDMGTGSLLEIDPSTGSVKAIGGAGSTNIQGLAFDNSGVLYASGTTSYAIDLNTGELTPVPELGYFRGLTFVDENLVIEKGAAAVVSISASILSEE